MICTPKDKGGLGIKNLEAFNTDLLTKWRWRVLVEGGNPLWKEVLIERFGLTGRWPRMEYKRGWNKHSIWWRDLCLLVEGTNLEAGWFDELVKLKLGRGNIVRFWTDCWLGKYCLADLFPTLFN